MQYMGYLCRHAIAVTGTYGDYINQAYEYAKSVGAMVTPIVEACVNMERTFFVVPDGSKEGWPQSDTGDQQRELILKHLKTYDYEDGSNPLSWAEFFYGDDSGHAGILNHN